MHACLSTDFWRLKGAGFYARSETQSVTPGFLNKFILAFLQKFLPRSPSIISFIAFERSLKFPPKIILYFCNSFFFGDAFRSSLRRLLHKFLPDFLQKCILEILFISSFRDFHMISFVDFRFL